MEAGKLKIKNLVKFALCLGFLFSSCSYLASFSAFMWQEEVGYKHLIYSNSSSKETSILWPMLHFQGYNSL